MINCGKIVLKVLISSVVILLAYEYGRYSAISEIYKRGWAVIENDHTEQGN